MDVPDLYNFLAQKISKASNYGPEILAVDIETDFKGGKIFSKIFGKLIYSRLK